MKNIVLIFRDLSTEENSEVRRASLRGAEIYAVEAIKVRNIDIRPISLEAEKKREINYQVMDQILQMGDKNIEGKRLADHLKVDEFASIWYYHKFRLYFQSRNKQYEISLCEKFLNDDAQLTVYSDYSFNSFPVMGNIKVIRPQSRKRRDYFSVAHYLVFFISRVFVSILKSPQRSFDHLIIDRSERQPVLLPDLTIKPGNYNLEYLFEKLDKRFAVLHEVEVPKFDRSNKFRFKWSYFRRGKKQAELLFGEYVLFRGLLSTEVRKKSNELRRSLAEKVSYLQANLDEPAERDTLEQLKSLESATVFFVFKYLAYERFFGRLNLKTVSSIDENSPSVKVILDSAKVKKITSVGIQHGNIHDLHPAYLFTQSDKYAQAMPDMTLAWGEKWKDFLMSRANYPEEKVKVAGQIRTDIIPVLKRKGLNIFSENAKNVVFASQPQRDPQLRFRAAWDVFSAIKDLGQDYFLYVKLHPGERGAENYYHTIAKNAGCTNYIILGEVDLYQVIASCDVLITCFSTVGTETVYFGKPLIILDHLKQDIQHYHRDGVAWQATDSVQLKSIIDGLASGRLKINSEAYRRFVRVNAFKIDGKVADRVIEIITGY